MEKTFALSFLGHPIRNGEKGLQLLLLASPIPQEHGHVQIHLQQADIPRCSVIQVTYVQVLTVKFQVSNLFPAVRVQVIKSRYKLVQVTKSRYTLHKANLS